MTTSPKATKKQVAHRLHIIFVIGKGDIFDPEYPKRLRVLM